MVAISFSVMKDKIKNGEKTQTIRPYSEKIYELIKRKRKLQLYWKMRTKECELLREAELEGIAIIRLYAPENLLDFNSRGTKIGHIHVWECHRWIPVTAKMMREIVRRDGFDSVNDMYEWFRKQYGEKVYDMNFMVVRWV